MVILQNTGQKTHALDIASFKRLTIFEKTSIWVTFVCSLINISVKGQ